MSNTTPGTPKIDPAVMDCIVCPLTRSKLRQEGKFLVSEIGGLKYPIIDGIPALLADEAELPEGFKTLDEFKAAFKDQIVE
jgi:uncharacterized protein YbaR (Trm112 family)